MDEQTDFGLEEREFQALQTVISLLKNLPTEARQRILDSAAIFLRIPNSRTSPAAPSNTNREPVINVPPGTFSQDRRISPKEFLHEKQPKTNVEKIACLAYYLTYYRDTPHFKTADLSILNTEAAQPKFTNAAFAVSDATKQGYLVPATKGNKQISAIGEQFVVSLPDRTTAKQIMSNRPKRKTKRNARPSRIEEMQVK